MPLKETLSDSLSSGFDCQIRYIRTPPKRSDALFSPLPGSDPEKTRQANHFLTVSIKTQAGDSTSEVMVLGLEVSVYHTRHLTTIFVSKADSTGYLPQRRPSPIRQITTAFMRWLSVEERRNHPKREIVISLFARSQAQYLFPGSAENGQKHILDDRQLIKWWARVLDPLFPDEANDLDYNGYITVPGYEGMEVRPFFPSPANLGKQWHPGNPLAELAETRGVSRNAPPRCLLPRFPDDPKARFMSDLDDEVGFSEGTLASPTKRKNGKWKSIWNLDRFWEAMEFRQECSSGRMVGFVWLVISNSAERRMREQARRAGADEHTSQESSIVAPSSDPILQQDERGVIHGSPPKRRKKPLSGPIISRQPRLKGGSSSLTMSSELESMLVPAAEDGLILTKEGYDQVMQTLLHLDFANPEVAAESTRKWVSQVASICGTRTDWSIDVTGTLKTTTSSEKSNGTQVNSLGAVVRKKRKVEDPAPAGNGADGEAGAESNALEKPAVNMLGAGMVRKKPKLPA